MAFDENLADRIRINLKMKKVPFTDRIMMGGIAFMVNDKMCVGVIKDNLMVRIAPEVYDDALQKPGCHVMDFTGRVLKGFVMVEPEAIDMDEDLEYWINLALDFNPRAKSSKNKKKKPRN